MRAVDVDEGGYAFVGIFDFGDGRGAARGFELVFRDAVGGYVVKSLCAVRETKTLALCAGTIRGRTYACDLVRNVYSMA